MYFGFPTRTRVIAKRRKRRWWKRLFAASSLIMHRPTTLLWRGCLRCWKLSTSGVSRTRLAKCDSSKQWIRENLKKCNYIAMQNASVYAGYFYTNYEFKLNRTFSSVLTLRLTKAPFVIFFSRCFYVYFFYY